MKQLLQQKLKSQEGASILMALFLFVICATLAAVVLAAGTAAAGRAAGLAETDQKYYSVTSAAELFREMMGGDEGVSAKIICQKQTVTIRENGSTTSITEGNPTCAIGSTPITNDNVGYVNLPSYVENAALKLLTANMGMADVGEYAWLWQFGTESGTEALRTNDFKFVHNVSGLTSEQKALIESVSIKATLQQNGDIVVRFTNGGKTQSYAVELVCKAEADTQMESTTNTEVSGGKVKLTRTDTKTTTLTWKAAEMKQIAASSTTGGGI